MTDTAVNGQDGGGWWPGATPPEPPPPPRPQEPAHAPAGLTQEQPAQRPRPADMPAGPPLQPQQRPMPQHVPPADPGPSRRERREAQPVSQPIRDRWAAQSRRYRWPMVGVVAIFGLLVVQRGIDRMATQFGDASSQSMAQVAAEIRDAAALPASKQTLTQVVVTPTDWMACDFSNDAKSMIGWDASTQFSTLDPVRSKAVSDQAKPLLVANTLASLRLTSVSPTDLTVLVGGSKGVPLVDCQGGNVPAAQTAPTAAAPADATTATVPR